MNKFYIKGRNFEYKVKKFFEEKGFKVFRSAGSKTLIDLIAINKEKIYLIQCKNSYLNLNQAENLLKKMKFEVPKNTFFIVFSKNIKLKQC